MTINLLSKIIENPITTVLCSQLPYSYVSYLWWHRRLHHHTTRWCCRLDNHNSTRGLLPVLDLGSRLTVDESPAAERAEGVILCRAVDAVPLPGLCPQEEGGDAGDAAAQAAATAGALAEVGGTATDEQARAEETVHAYLAIIEAAKDVLLPVPRHVDGWELPSPH